MVRHASLFSQVLSLIDRHEFARSASELEAEKGAKGFTCCWIMMGTCRCLRTLAKAGKRS